MPFLLKRNGVFLWYNIIKAMKGVKRLKYKVIEREEINYAGIKMTVNANKIEESNFGEIWTQLFSKINFNYLKTTGAIGLETYEDNFENDGLFEYHALVPVENFDRIDECFSKVMVPKGRYLAFKTTLHELGKDFIMSCYRYASEEGHKIDGSLDFEFYPDTFNPSVGNFEIFFCLKLED